MLETVWLVVSVTVLLPTVFKLSWNRAVFLPVMLVTQGVDLRERCGLRFRLQWA